MSIWQNFISSLVNWYDFRHISIVINGPKLKKQSSHLVSLALLATLTCTRGWKRNHPSSLSMPEFWNEAFLFRVSGQAENFFDVFAVGLVFLDRVFGSDFSLRANGGLERGSVKFTHLSWRHSPETFWFQLALRLVHTSCRSQRQLQRARSLQIIGHVSIFTALHCYSCLSQQICS